MAGVRMGKAQLPSTSEREIELMQGELRLMQIDLKGMSTRMDLMFEMMKAQGESIKLQSETIDHLLELDKAPKRARAKNPEA